MVYKTSLNPQYNMPQVACNQARREYNHVCVIDISIVLVYDS